MENVQNSDLCAAGPLQTEAQRIEVGSVRRGWGGVELNLTP